MQHVPAAFVKPATVDTVDEIRALRLVQGDGIVPLLGVDGDRAVLAAARCSIADVIHTRGRLAAAEVRAVVVAVAQALQRCGHHQLVHGDVKPANVLLDDDGEIWLADFDAAGPVGSPRRRHSPGRSNAPTRLETDDDRLGLLSTALECAIGHPVDLDAGWDALALTAAGVDADLAAELALALRRPMPLDALTALFEHGERRFPGPVAGGGADATPTVEFRLNAPS